MGKSIALCTALLGLAAALSLAARADEDNLLRDPGFELGTPPDQGGWQQFEDGQVSSDVARSGEKSMFHYAFSRTVPYPPFVIGTVSGSYQEFPAAPGSRWRLTGYGLTRTKLEGTPAFGIVQVSFFDASGRDLGSLETVGEDSPKARISNEINNQTPVGEWIFLDTGIATAPEGTKTVQAFTLYVDYSNSNRSQGVYFDDLKLYAVKDARD